MVQNSIGNYLAGLSKQVGAYNVDKEKAEAKLAANAESARRWDIANTRAEDQALRLKTADELKEQQRKAESTYNTTLLDKNVYRPGGISEGVEANKDVMNNLQLSMQDMDKGVDKKVYEGLNLKGPNTLTNVTNELAKNYASKGGAAGTPEYEAGLQQFLKTNLGDTDYNRYKTNEEYQLKIGEDLVNDPRFKASTIEKFDLAKQALLDAGGSVTNQIADQGMQAQAKELTLRTAERDKRQKALDTANKAIAEATIDELKAKGKGTSGGGLAALYNKAEKTEDGEEVKAVIEAYAGKGYTVKQLSDAYARTDKGGGLTDVGDPEFEIKDFQDHLAKITPGASTKANTNELSTEYAKRLKLAQADKAAAQKALTGFELDPTKARLEELRLAAGDNVGTYQLPVTQQDATTPKTSEKIKLDNFSTVPVDNTVPKLRFQDNQVPDISANTLADYVNTYGGTTKDAQLQLDEYFGNKPAIKKLSYGGGIQPSALTKVLGENVINTNNVTMPIPLGTTRPGYYDNVPAKSLDTSVLLKSNAVRPNTTPINWNNINAGGKIDGQQIARDLGLTEAVGNAASRIDPSILTSIQQSLGNTGTARLLSTYASMFDGKTALEQKELAQKLIRDMSINKQLDLDTRTNFKLH